MLNSASPRLSGCISIANKKTSLSYRLRVGSSVIENLTPEESLDLVLRVILSGLDDGEALVELEEPRWTRLSIRNRVPYEKAQRKRL